ncbi:alpha/beta hydrolase [Ectothiorhodospiraceae bacterium WFHF3C12]|nr:alpha/beta hydrolase [Ectothiorhodospiraceae bacterium WFHF3C12]
MEVRHARVNGCELAYVDTGAGEPLLLVHGSLCDYRYWPLQARALADRYRVISLSLRHYYPAQWDGRGEGFQPDNQAEDVAAFIRQLDAGPVHLLGHSRGGYIAAQVARRHPTLVSSLILADPGGDLDPSLLIGDEPVGIDHGMLETCVAHLRDNRVDEALAHFVDTVHGPGAWAANPEKFKQGARDNAHTLLGQVREVREPFSAAMLAGIMAPTLLIGGADSPAPFPRILDALEANIPRARRVTIRDASHGMNLEQPARFNEAVRHFLDELQN